jgi:hypothetical protein
MAEAKSARDIAIAKILSDPKLFKSVAERFWGKVDLDPATGCWLWSGASEGRGYGNFKAMSHVTVRAHRVAFALSRGRAPESGLVIRHKCHNPLCCNPAHLEEGTHQDNSDDMKRAGRWSGGPSKGAENGNSKLTEEQVAEIRARLKRGETNVSIAEDFPVGHAMISKIRRGHAWH